MSARLELVRRNDAIRASSEPARVLAERHGLTPSAVSRIRSEPGRALTRKERFQLEVLEGGWRAACMDDDEWTDWVQQNPTNVGVDAAFADRPCRDCPASFATEMRALGRCNGQPSGSEGEPAQHSDEEDQGVMDSRPGGGRGQPLPLALAMPPCETCLHEPVCVLRHALKKVTTIEATPAALPDGLTVALTATVECRFYNRKKGAKRVLSPAALEAARASAAAMRARKAAKAVAE